MAGNEYDALIAESPEAQAKAVTNEYDALVVDFTKERSQRTRASIYSAQDANPDTTAKAITLSRKTGIPVDTVERDVKAVEGPAALNEYDALVQKSPGLGRWLEDPINARVAKDDYESLGLLEKGWNEVRRGFLGSRGDVQALGAAVAGQRGADLTAALEKAQRGEYLTPLERAMVAQAPEVRANVEAAGSTAIGKLLQNKRAANEIPMLPALREMNEAKTWGEAWSAFTKAPIGIIYALTAQNLPQLAGTIAATVVGGPAVGVGVTGGQSFAQEFVGGILDNMQELGVNTNDPDALRAAFANPDLMATVYRKSTIKASIVGTLDAATMGIAGKTLAPAAIKSRLAREAVNIPAQLATQMAGGAGGEALGSVAAGNEVKPGAVLAEAVAELGGTPAEIAAMRSHFGKTAKAISPEHLAATVQAAGLDKLIADAQSTKLAGRSPEKLAEFLETVAGPDQNVFVPVEAVQAYFQSKPIEDMQAQMDALGISDQYPEALATGGDVVIPLAKYVTEAGKSDVHKAWREDVRLEADGFSIRQAQEDAKIRDERLKLAVDRFEKQLEAGVAEVDATTRVYEDIRDKLKTAGRFTNEAAEQQAAVFAEHYATRAARNPGSYLDAWDAYSKAGLGTGMDIRTQLSDRVAAQPPDDLDVLLNSIRSGKVTPTKADADANAQFLKDREELAGALSDLKLDPKKLSNAQIRAAIKAEVEKRKAGGQTYEQPVYHGGPHIFDRFSLDKIGTGEGAQAFGWGLYFAGRKEIAEHYRRALSSGKAEWKVGGKSVSYQDALEAVRQTLKTTWDVNRFGSMVANGRVLADLMVALEGNSDASVRDAYKGVAVAAPMLEAIDKTVKLERPGRLYHVEIPDDGSYLHWDKPLSEQSPEVQAALKKMGIKPPTPPAPPRSPVLASILRRALKQNDGDPRDIGLTINNDGALYKLASAEAGAKRLEQLDLSPGEWVEKQAKEYLDGLKAEREFTGEKIYKALSQKLAPPEPADPAGTPRGWGFATRGNEGDKAASLALREAGIPGIQYLDASSRNDGEGSHNYVLFDDSLATIKQYEQEARGQITFADNLSTITLFQGRDLSTLLHETGHLWLEELGFDAKSLNAPEQIKADYQAVLDWLGSKDGYITRDMHEQFARGFETYVMEGKAPSAGLASAFRSFKRWLTQIYKRLTALNAPITPEIRQVFDRLIATDEQIENAQTRQGLNPIFKDAESAGMTKAEFDAYTKRANAVVDEAEQKLLQATMDTIRKQRTKEWNADEARVREEVRGEVLSESGQQALALLTKGEFPVGTTPEVLKGIKLTKEGIVNLYGDETVLTMLPAGIYRDRASGPGAMSPDELAPMLGLDSGKDLIERLMQLEAQKRAQAAKGDKRSVARAKIDEETAQRMAERYGDPLNDGTIEQEAMAAVHSDKQAALMATELRVLAKKAGHTGTITWDDIKGWAAEAIADKSVREGTKFDQYARAERTAGRKVEQALIKGDFVAAFKAKQDQMVNHALYMEARQAAADVESARKMMDRYAAAETIKSMDQEYLEQIHQLLEQYEFKSRSAKFLEERKSYETWAIEQEAKGFEVIPPPRLDKGLFTINYRDMTVDELRGLADTVKQIAHLGRFKQEMLDGQKKRAFEAAKAEIIAAIDATPQTGVSRVDRGKTSLQKSIGEAGHWIWQADAIQLKLETILEWLDGDKSGRGPLSRMIFQRMSSAQTAREDMRVELGKRQREAFERVPEAQRKTWADVVTVPELLTDGAPAKLNRSNLISIALNVGNEGNLDKMLRGEKWDADAVQAVLDKHLSKEEWQFVQDTWGNIETLWPRSSEMERRVNGVAPPKVDAREVKTPFGTLKGGYYPAAYDRNASEAGRKIDLKKAEGLFDTAYPRASTRAGATRKRTGFAAPIDLSLSVIGQHINDMTHDIAFREAVIDAYRLLSDEDIRNAIKRALGPEYAEQLEPAIKYIANESVVDRTAQQGLDKILRWSRMNTTVVGLGFRLTTMMSQLVGYSNTIQRLGLKDFTKGWTAFLRNPAEAARTVRSMSGEMRYRADVIDRDMGALLKKMEGKANAKDEIVRWGFRGVALFDAAVSIPAWMGAYQQALRQKMTDAEAIQYADKLVRDTQGANAAKDLAGLMRGGEPQRLLTVFGSYMSTLYQRQRGLARDARNIHSVADAMDVLAQSWWLLVVPALLAPLITRQGPDDDEDWGTWIARNLIANNLASIPLVRDFANVVSNKVGGKGSFGGVKLSPVQSTFDNLIHTGNDVVKILGGDDPSDNALKAAFSTVGFLTGLPGGQVGQTSQFLWDALVSGSQNPETIREWLSGLAYGPKK